MKSLVPLLFAIVVYSEHVLGLKFINPVVLKVQERFKLSWEELETKCNRKTATLFSEISNLRDKYDLESAQVKNAILSRAKISCDMTDGKWNLLINEKCYPNQDLIFVSQRSIDKIQLCLDKMDRLNEKQTKEVKRELLESFCSMIRIWAKFEYMNHEKCKGIEKTT